MKQKPPFWHGLFEHGSHGTLHGTTGAACVDVVVHGALKIIYFILNNILFIFSFLNQTQNQIKPNLVSFESNSILKFIKLLKMKFYNLNYLLLL